jgi:hypothetical protein
MCDATRPAYQCHGGEQHPLDRGTGGSVSLATRLHNDFASLTRITELSAPLLANSEE